MTRLNLILREKQVQVYNYIIRKSFPTGHIWENIVGINANHPVRILKARQREEFGMEVDIDEI